MRPKYFKTKPKFSHHFGKIKLVTKKSSERTIKATWISTEGEAQYSKQSLVNIERMENLGAFIRDN